MPILPGSLWPKMLVTDKFPAIGQIEIFSNLLYFKQLVCKQMINVQLIFWYNKELLETIYLYRKILLILNIIISVELHFLETI